MLLPQFQDEAYGLWKTQWRNLYEEESTSWKVIDHVCRTYYLVNLVDNDFVDGNAIYEMLSKVIKYQDEIRAGLTEEPLSPMEVDNAESRPDSSELTVGACGGRS